ncbi:unnamed protein product [Leuciscus chuanchicus]
MTKHMREKYCVSSLRLSVFSTVRLSVSDGEAHEAEDLGTSPIVPVVFCAGKADHVLNSLVKRGMFGGVRATEEEKNKNIKTFYWLIFAPVESDSPRSAEWCLYACNPSRALDVEAHEFVQRTPTGHSLQRFTGDPRASAPHVPFAPVITGDQRASAPQAPFAPAFHWRPESVRSTGSVCPGVSLETRERPLHRLRLPRRFTGDPRASAPQAPFAPAFHWRPESVRSTDSVCPGVSLETRERPLHRLRLPRRFTGEQRASTPQAPFAPAFHWRPESVRSTGSFAPAFHWRPESVRTTGSVCPGVSLETREHPLHRLRLPRCFTGDPRASAPQAPFAPVFHWRPESVRSTGSVCPGVSLESRERPLHRLRLPRRFTGDQRASAPQAPFAPAFHWRPESVRSTGSFAPAFHWRPESVRTTGSVCPGVSLETRERSLHRLRLPRRFTGDPRASAPQALFAPAFNWRPESIRTTDSVCPGVSLETRERLHHRLRLPRRLTGDPRASAPQAPFAPAFHWRPESVRTTGSVCPGVSLETRERPHHRLRLPRRFTGDQRASAPQAPFAPAFHWRPESVRSTGSICPGVSLETRERPLHRHRLPRLRLPRHFTGDLRASTPQAPFAPAFHWRPESVHSTGSVGPGVSLETRERLHHRLRLPPRFTGDPRASAPQAPFAPAFHWRPASVRTTGSVCPGVSLESRERPLHRLRLPRRFTGDPRVSAPQAPFALVFHWRPESVRSTGSVCPGVSLETRERLLNRLRLPPRFTGDPRVSAPQAPFAPAFNWRPESVRSTGSVCPGVSLETRECPHHRLRLPRRFTGDPRASAPQAPFAPAFHWRSESVRTTGSVSPGVSLETRERPLHRLRLPRRFTGDPRASAPQAPFAPAFHWRPESVRSTGSVCPGVSLESRERPLHRLRLPRRLTGDPRPSAPQTPFAPAFHWRPESIRTTGSVCPSVSLETRERPLHRLRLPRRFTGDLRASAPQAPFAPAFHWRAESVCTTGSVCPDISLESRERPHHRLRLPRCFTGDPRASAPQAPFAPAFHWRAESVRSIGSVCPGVSLETRERLHHRLRLPRRFTGEQRASAPQAPFAPAFHWRPESVRTTDSVCPVVSLETRERPLHRLRLPRCFTGDQRASAPQTPFAPLFHWRPESVRSTGSVCPGVSLETRERPHHRLRLPRCFTGDPRASAPQTPFAPLFHWRPESVRTTDSVCPVVSLETRERPHHRLRLPRCFTGDPRASAPQAPFAPAFHWRAESVRSIGSVCSGVSLETRERLHHRLRLPRRFTGEQRASAPQAPFAPAFHWRPESVRSTGSVCPGVSLESRERPLHRLRLPRCFTGDPRASAPQAPFAPAFHWRAESVRSTGSVCPGVSLETRERLHHRLRLPRREVVEGLICTHAHFNPSSA